jgi:hypothetical protein
VRPHGIVSVPDRICSILYGIGFHQQLIRCGQRLRRHRQYRFFRLQQFRYDHRFGGLVRFVNQRIDLRRARTETEKR